MRVTTNPAILLKSIMLSILSGMETMQFQVLTFGWFLILGALYGVRKDSFGSKCNKTDLEPATSNAFAFGRPKQSRF